MLHDFELTIPKEENDKVDSLRYSFQKLIVSAVSQSACLEYFISPAEGEGIYFLLCQSLYSFICPDFSFQICRTK